MSLKKKYEFQIHFFRDKELEEIEDIFRNIGIFMYCFDKYFKQPYVSGNYLYSNGLNSSRVFVSDNRYNIKYMVSIGKEDELLTLWQSKDVSEHTYEYVLLFTYPVCELPQKEAEIEETLNKYTTEDNSDRTE